MRKDVFQIVLTLLGVGVSVWLYLKLVALLDEWFECRFGWSLRRQRAPKVEVQTLFHGNTKDEDQI
jgi:hypothetical protein